MITNIRPIRDCIAAFNGKVGNRRFPFWSMTQSSVHNTALHVKPGIGDISVPPEFCFAKMIGGTEIFSMGLIGDLLDRNHIETPDDFAGHAWTATNVTVGAATVADMYGGTDAQALTPSDVAGKVRMVNNHVTLASRSVLFQVDLRADVAHNARISVDNNQGTEVTQDCAVTTTWNRFYVYTSYGAAANQSQCVSIYPDIDAGTAVVYARMPYLLVNAATLKTNEMFGSSNPTAYSGGEASGGYNKIGCAHIPAFFSLRKGTIAIFYNPLYNVSCVSGANNSIFVAYICLDDSSVYNVLGLYFDDTNLVGFITDTDGNTLTTSVALADVNMVRGTDVFLSVSWKANYFGLYKNGVLIGSDNTQILSNFATPNQVPLLKSGMGLNSAASIAVTTGGNSYHGVIHHPQYYPHYKDANGHLALFNKWKRYGGL